MAGQVIGEAPDGEPAKRRKVLRFLGHPWWQGLGAISGTVGVMVALLTYGIADDGAPMDRGGGQNEAVVTPPPSQDGSPGQPLVSPEGISTSPTSTPIPVLNEPTFLDEMEPVDGYLERGERKVAGHVYDHALSRAIGATGMCGDIEAAVAGFDLNLQYTKFTVTVGLSDDAASGVDARFKIYGDTRGKRQLLRSASAGLGEPKSLTVPVAGVLRLTLEASTNICQYGDYGEVVWADPIVIP